MSIPHITVQLISGLYTVKVETLTIVEVTPQSTQLLGRLPPRLVFPGLRYVLEYVQYDRHEDAMRGPRYLAGFYTRAAAATACNMIMAAMTTAGRESFYTVDIREWERYGRADYENMNYAANEQHYNRQRERNQRSIDLHEDGEREGEHTMRLPGEMRREQHEAIFGIQPVNTTLATEQRSLREEMVREFGVAAPEVAEGHVGEEGSARHELGAQGWNAENSVPGDTGPQNPYDRDGVDGPIGDPGEPGIQGPPGAAEEAAGYSRIFPAGGGMLLMSPDGLIEEVSGPARDTFSVGARLPAGTMFTTLSGAYLEHTSPPIPQAPTGPVRGSYNREIATVAGGVGGILYSLLSAVVRNEFLQRLVQHEDPGVQLFARVVARIFQIDDEHVARQTDFPGLPGSPLASPSGVNLEQRAIETELQLTAFMAQEREPRPRGATGPTGFTGGAGSTGQADRPYDVERTSNPDRPVNDDRAEDSARRIFGPPDRPTHPA